MADTIYIVAVADVAAANTAMGGVGNFNKSASLCKRPASSVTHRAIATEIDLSGYLSSISSLETVDGGSDNTAALDAAGYDIHVDTT